jgi:hypothetical protein
MVNTISDVAWAVVQERARAANPLRDQVGHPEQVRASRQSAAVREAELIMLGDAVDRVSAATATTVPGGPLARRCVVLAGHCTRQH